MSRTRTSTRAVIGATALLLAAGAALADPMVAITAATPGLGQLLVSFDTDAPSVALPGLPISGLQPGETILGIDFRPANGELFGLGSTGRLYVLDATTGVAAQRGKGTFAIALRGDSFGFDFNPTVDRIRVTSDAGQNLRLNPNNGAVVDADVNTPGVQADGDLAYATGDVNQGATPGVVASGYTNSFFGATVTTLFNIDAGLNVLVRQAPPNAGTLNTVAPVSIDVDSSTAFEIAPRDNTAFITGPGTLPIGTGLYTLDLTTGSAEMVGDIGTPLPIQGMSIRPSMCACDFNRDYTLNSQDFFDYMNAFWANEARANFNRDATVNSQDFFDFLVCFFNQTPPCDSL